MFLKSCKLLFKISLLITISSSLIDCKSIKKRQAYQEYQQPYYHQRVIGNQEYLPKQQYQSISEAQYQQAQLDHINQHLKHQIIGPQTQNYHNHDRVQYYQQENYNKDQLNHPLNGRYINQHREQHPTQFEEHYSNGEESYKQNRRHIDENVEQEQQEVKEEITEPTVINNENQENHSSTSNESKSGNNSGIPKEENQTDGPENTKGLTKKEEEVLMKELDNENEISGEILKETNKREEDCESKEYVAAKHENEEKKANEEEDCESKEYLEAKHEVEGNDEKKEEDCESKEYIAAKHEIEGKDENKEEHDDSKEYIAAKQSINENGENEEDCKSKEYLEARHTEQNEDKEKEIITQPKELIDETVLTNEKTEEIHKDLDPHSIPTSGDNTRNERTIGRLHELEDPRTIIDNFRHKLKTARSNIEQAEMMNRRKADPRVFIYDPKLPAIPSTYPTEVHHSYVPNHDHNIEDYQINDSLPKNKYRQSLFEGLKGKSTKENGPSPTANNNFSDSSEEKKIEENKTTGLKDENFAEELKNDKVPMQQQTPRYAHGRNTHPEEMRQLLQVRDEINRIRHIMQVLKEHDLKQRFGPKFQNTRNLTATEQKEMEEFVEKLKKEGKISTSPLKPQNEGIQSNPGDVPDIKQLVEEIGKLKESIKHFAKNVGVNKDDSTEANLEKLEEQIGEQKHEIENLRKLVADLIPPTDFPSATSSAVIKHPDLEKHHLRHELQTLQEVLNDLLNKEEKTLKTAQDVAGKLRFRASEDDSKADASEKEIGTLVKILHTVQQQPAENRDLILEKLNDMKDEIKKLDIQNKKTRQELFLEKLEREVKDFKDSKPSNGDNAEELAEKIKKLEEEIERHHKKPTTINSKLEELEKQIQHLSKPMGRELDDHKKPTTTINSKLEKLEKQIQNLSKPMGRELDDHKKPTIVSKLEDLEKQIQHLSKPMGRELNDNIEKELDRLQKQITNLNTKDDVKPAGRQLEGLISDILLNNDDNSDEKHEHLPPHAILHGGSNQQAPVFQIPYCLQKHPHYAVYQEEGSNIAPPDFAHHHHPNKQQQLTANYNNEPQSNSYANIKYIPQSQPVVIQQQKPIYSKPVAELHQPIKPIPHQVYGPPKPPTYAPNKVYAPQKPVQTIIHEVAKPIHVDAQQGYASTNTNQYNAAPANKGQKPCTHSEAMEEEIKKLNNMLSVLNEKMEYGTDPEPEDYEAVYRSKNSKIRTKREIEQINIDEDKEHLIEEIRERLADLRKQVQTVDEPQPFGNTSDQQNGQRSAYYDTEDSHHHSSGSKFSLKKKQKFDDLFIKLVKFILHKLEISAPYVIESLFNGESNYYDQGYDSYGSNENSYGYDNGYRSSQKFRSSDDDADFDNNSEYNEENEIENKKQNGFGGLLNSFQGFPGLLGFIPSILLKLLSNFSSFLTILKKNKFFKNFLIPGALILVVDGIMGLLIWWFSADDKQNLFDFNIKHNY